MTISKKIFFSFIIFLFLFIFLFIFIEISSRVYSFYFKKNFCAKSLTLEKYSSIPDKKLGYIPKEGKKIGCEKENYTINSEGIRLYENYNFENSDFLIVGDSFGFGDEVSDNETLSYLLYKNHNIKTINAAVYGYGLDQSLLRAENFLKKKKMDVLLIIAPGGWSRVNQSIRNGIKKPYYLKNEINKLELILPNQTKFNKSIKTHLVEKSIFIKFIVSKFRLKKLLEQNIYLYDMKDINKSCRIITNFNNSSILGGHSFHLIFYRDAQEIYKKNLGNYEKTNNLLKCLKKNKINYLDTYSVLNKNKNSKIYVKKLYGHPNLNANILVSKEINDYINSK